MNSRPTKYTINPILRALTVRNISFGTLYAPLTAIAPCDMLQATCLHVF